VPVAEHVGLLGSGDQKVVDSTPRLSVYFSPGNLSKLFLLQSSDVPHKGTQMQQGHASRMGGVLQCPFEDSSPDGHDGETIHPT
jgi:hypothetical protein